MPDPMTPAPITPIFSSLMDPESHDLGTVAAVTSRDVASMIGVTFIWGVAFVGIKEVLASSPPLLTAGVRFELGGLLLLPLVRRRPTGPGARKRAPRLYEMLGI